MNTVYDALFFGYGS